MVILLVCCLQLVPTTDAHISTQGIKTPSHVWYCVHAWWIPIISYTNPGLSDSVYKPENRPQNVIHLTMRYMYFYNIRILIHFREILKIPGCLCVRRRYIDISLQKHISCMGRFSTFWDNEIFLLFELFSKMLFLFHSFFHSLFWFTRPLIYWYSPLSGPYAGISKINSEKGAGFGPVSIRIT